MILETFPVGPLQCNCTILGDQAAGEAIVIDPGDDITRIHRRISDLGLKLKQILITHGHIDHVGGALKLKRLTGAPIFLNENDLPQLTMMDMQAAWLGVPTPEVAPPDESLTDGMTVGLSSYPAQVHSYSRTYARIGLPAFHALEPPNRRRHPLRRQHWPHRSPRRRHRPDHRVH